MKWFCQKSPFWRACELQPAALYTRPGEVSFKNSSQEAARTCIDISQAWINQILDSFHDLPKTCGVFHFPEPAGKTVCFWHKLIADDVSTNDCMFPDHVLFVPPLHLAAVKDSAPIFLGGENGTFADSNPKFRPFPKGFSRSFREGVMVQLPCWVAFPATAWLRHATTMVGCPEIHIGKQGSRF